MSPSRRMVAKTAALIGILFSLWQLPSARATDINFDTLNTSSGCVTGATLDSYLVGFGITHTQNLGVSLAVCAAPNFEVPSSPPNVFTSFGPGTGYNFTLQFNAPVNDVNFNRVGLIATTPSGVSMATWSATAFSASNVALGTVGEPLLRSFGTIPLQNFSLGFTGIDHVTFFSNVENFAGTNLVIDDLAFEQPVPEPCSLLLLGTGFLGVVGAVRRRRLG